MYFSLQKSGELLQSEEAPGSGLYFDCDKLPVDWYSQLRAEFGKKPQETKAPASEVKAPAKAKSEAKTPAV